MKPQFVNGFDVNTVIHYLGNPMWNPLPNQLINYVGLELAHQRVEHSLCACYPILLVCIVQAVLNLILWQCTQSLQVSVIIVYVFWDHVKGCQNFILIE